MFNFPWSNFHELNLDWILSVVKEAKEIFVKGEGDIQHAVETADQALETAEQAAAGVIADGAVTIPKLNSEVYSLLAYCVSGSVAPNFIPAGALVIVRKSTISNVTDGIYTATRDIQQATIITAADLDQSATLAREGGMNYLLHNEEKLNGTIDLIKAGLVILVSGDEASAVIPADGLAYVVNNTHGLAEGFYFNSSGAAFPTTGGTADSDSFTATDNILNALQTAISTLGSDDITNDSTVTGASVSDALDDVKNTLTQIETETETVENGLAIIVEGNTCASGASIGQYIYLKDSTISGYADGLYTAAQTIPANTAIDGTYLTAVSNGGLNSILAISDVSFNLSQKIRRAPYSNFAVKKVGKIIILQGYVNITSAFTANEELLSLTGVTFNNITGYAYFGSMMAAGNTTYTICLKPNGSVAMDVSASPTGDVGLFLIAFCD